MSQSHQPIVFETNTEEGSEPARTATRRLLTDLGTPGVGYFVP